MLISLIPAIVKEATEKGLFFIGQERGVIRFPGSHALGITKKNKVQKRIADSFSLPYNRISLPSGISCFLRRAFPTQLKCDVKFSFVSSSGVFVTGRGFSAKFRAGVCRPQFQNGTVG